MTTKSPSDGAALQSPSYEALQLIVSSISAALARAGITECDDPGEAIDVLREGYEARLRGDGEQGQAVAVYMIRGDHGTWTEQSKAAHDWWEGKADAPDRRVLYDRPQPVAVAGDAVRQLVEKWRRFAKINGNELTAKTLWEVADELEAALSTQPAPSAPVVDWKPIATAPRDGTVIELRFGEEGQMPGWWQEIEFDGHRKYPWAFFERGVDKRTFVNHAVDGGGGPSHWRPYAAALSAPSEQVAASVAVPDAALGAWLRAELGKTKPIKTVSGKDVFGVMLPAVDRDAGVDAAIREAIAAAPVAPASPPPFDFLAHLARQAAFSLRTFGPGARAQCVVDHIRKELAEIEADPGDLAEWIDVAILALDGAWRSGATPQQIVDALVAKQTRNEGRTWPDWRSADPTKAIEHDRSGETPANSYGVVSHAQMERESAHYVSSTGAENDRFNEMRARDIAAMEKQKGGGDAG